MKHLIRLFLILTFAYAMTSCTGKDSFVIKGNIRSLPTPRAYLTRVSPLTGEKDTLDASDIHNGSFSFKGRVEFPSMCKIEFGNRSIDVMVENSTIEISGTIMIPDQIKIVGSKANDDWTRLLKFERRFEARRREKWLDIIKSENNEDVEKLEQEYYYGFDSLLYRLKSEIAYNPMSHGCAYYIYYAYVNQLFGLDKLSQCMCMLDYESVCKSEYYRYMRDEVALYSGLQLNTKAPEFSLTRSNSDYISLESFYNRAFYIYFSASWCDSCATYEKSIEEIYKKFHPFGFDVLLVSLDKEKDDLKELAQRHPEWIVASDFLYWESPVTKRYGVQSIPYGVLVDDKQNVCAVNPSIHTLGYKLRNILR